LTKSRISELETGKIGNPQTKTVDALCVRLNISREERSACYSTSTASLPPKLLEKLALHFGHDLPNSKEGELEAFLVAKAEEFWEMRGRLKSLAESENRISELINSADAALVEGKFKSADALLEEAEEVQLQSSTIVALNRQSRLRIERGNASLVAGNVTEAADHFIRSSRYYLGVDPEVEASNRHECANLLRYYGYRYRSHEALYAAQTELEQNLGILNTDDHAEKWCEAKSALGGVSWRLSQFDIPENASFHLEEAKRHCEDVRALCSRKYLPKNFVIATFDLATVQSDRHHVDSEEEYETNLQSALSLQLSALPFISKSEDSRGWGIVQHNLACSYIHLSDVRTDKEKSVADIENAIRHAELSFEVRNPEDSLQYWVASCRTLGEALINMSRYSINSDADNFIRRASDVLHRAVAMISSVEHPHQWAEIQEQLSRCN